MFKNVILFPHRAGQLLKGVDKSPKTLSLYLNKDIIKHNVICTNNIFTNILNLYETNKNITGPKINIGGDHSMAIGTIADSLNKHPNTKVIWIDAHADLNTYEKSKSKNYHGMPLSYLTGLDKLEYFSFINNKLPFENLLYIGLRDLDNFEVDIIKKNNIKQISVDEFNNNELSEIYKKISKFIGNDPIHISFDVDGIDPRHIPCTGTPVNNGLCFSKTKALLDILYHENILNIDITELNLNIGNINEQYLSLQNTVHLFKKYI